MSLTVSRPALVTALRSLSGAISRRTAHPAVGQVEIRVLGSAPGPEKDGAVWLAMTDFQVTAWIVVPHGSQVDDLTAIVDAERLLRFLSHDPADEVSLSIGEGRGDLVVAGRSTAKLACMPQEAYAENPVPPAEGWESLPAEPLLDALQRVSWASGTGKLRSPSTLCLRSPGEALVDAWAMRDGRIVAGVQGFCASVLDPEEWFARGIGVSSGVADFLAARRLDPGASIEVAVEPGRRAWWRGPGFQVAEQWAEDQVHPDYGKIFDVTGRNAPLVATLSEAQAEELISGLHTLSGLGSWGLGSEDKRTDVLRVKIPGEGPGLELALRSDTVSGDFVVPLNPDGIMTWHTSFPGELVKALSMLSGGGDIEVRCHEGMHLFLFNERGGCASLSGRMP